MHNYAFSQNVRVGVAFLRDPKSRDLRYLMRSNKVRPYGRAPSRKALPPGELAFAKQMTERAAHHPRHPEQSEGSFFEARLKRSFGRKRCLLPQDDTGVGCTITPFRRMYATRKAGSFRILKQKSRPGGQPQESLYSISIFFTP